MPVKTRKIFYWIFTILFALFMLMNGFGGITRQQAEVDVMQHLGYPVYVLTIFGIAKLFESMTIKPVEASFGSYPDKSVAILNNATDRVGG